MSESTSVPYTTLLRRQRQYDNELNELLSIEDPDEDTSIMIEIKMYEIEELNNELARRSDEAPQPRQLQLQRQRQRQCNCPDCIRADSFNYFTRSDSFQYHDLSIDSFKYITEFQEPYIDPNEDSFKYFTRVEEAPVNNDIQAFINLLSGLNDLGGILNMGRNMEDQPVPLPQEMIDKIEGIEFNNQEIDPCFCGDDYKTGDIISKLPCNHLYHKTCIDKWFTQKPSCPMCRKDIRECFTTETQVA